MATTISAVVYERHKKADGTHNMKFRVYHKRQRKLMDTDHYVTSSQLTKDLEIKDTFVKNQIEDELKKHRQNISELGKTLQNFTAENLTTPISELSRFRIIPLRIT